MKKFCSGEGAAEEAGAGGSILSQYIALDANMKGVVVVTMVAVAIAVAVAVIVVVVVSSSSESLGVGRI